jgi:hypothetical protein
VTIEGVDYNILCLSCHDTQHTTLDGMPANNDVHTQQLRSFTHYTAEMCSMKLVTFDRLQAKLQNMPHILLAANTSCILLGAKGGSGNSCDNTAPHGVLHWRHFE